MAIHVIHQLVREVPRPTLLICFPKIFNNFNSRVQRYTVHQPSLYCGYLLKNVSHADNHLLWGYTWLLNAFHTNSILSKAGQIPVSNDTLVKLVDEKRKSMGVMEYKQVKNLAQQKHKKLIHVTNKESMDTDFEVFMLVADDKNVKGKSAKGAKIQTLQLKSRITDYDLEHKLKKVNAWMTKGFEVHVVILRKDNNVKVYAYL